jgi:hypothetical protein
VSSEDEIAQGTPDVSVSVTTPRISVRALAPTAANARLADIVTPLAMVNEVADPIAVPAELRKAMVPVQEAAVPPDDSAARFVKLICAVSAVASPIGAELDSCVVVVVVVVVWAIAVPVIKAQMPISVVTSLRNISV